MSESAKDFDLEHWKEVCYAHEAELEWLRAENARLMAEVEWLHGLMDGMITEVSRWSIKASEEMEAIYHARAALEVKP